MRSEGQVRHKLKQVLFRHLQKKLRLAFRHRPDTCLHNQTLEGDDFRASVCGCEKGGSGKICDARLPVSLEQAQICPWWEPLKSKDDFKAEFRKLIESSERSVIATEYPDVAALLWILDEDVSETIKEAVTDVDEGGEGEA